MQDDGKSKAEWRAEARSLRAQLREERRGGSSPPGCEETLSSVAGAQRLFYDAFHLGSFSLAIFRLEDGAFIDANEEFLKLSGYEREEIIGNSSLSLGLWERPADRRRVMQDVQAHGDVHDVETIIRRKDGAKREVLTSARQIEVEDEACVLTSAVDVTERKRAERSERESQALFRKIFRLSPTPICITRIEEGTFVDFNEAYCSMMNYERKELVDQALETLKIWDEREKRRCLIDELRAEDGAVRDREITMHRKDGEPVTLLGSFQRIQIDGEDCLLSVLSDITRRKEAEQALREAKEDAEAMDQFKTSVLENLTHEVRTPMTVILGFVSVLREGVRPNYERFVDLVERSGRRLLLMLDAILDLAQLEAGTLDPSNDCFNANGVVRVASDTLRPIAEEQGLDFEIDVPLEPTYVRADHDMLMRVVNNLVDNAIKFTDEGSVELMLRRAGDEVVIYVRDTGGGIKADYLQELFTEFTQESEGMERSHQGMGLGLAVTKRLVEHMDGSIAVDSTKGEGTEFRVRLPRAERMNTAA
jgi:PAS domain S-box-containing protein